jgi:hypothetical protein
MRVPLETTVNEPGGSGASAPGDDLHAPTTPAAAQSRTQTRTTRRQDRMNDIIPPFERCFSRLLPLQGARLSACTSRRIVDARKAAVNTWPPTPGRSPPVPRLNGVVAAHVSGSASPGALRLPPRLLRWRHWSRPRPCRTRPSRYASTTVHPSLRRPRRRRGSPSRSRQRGQGTSSYRRSPSSA